MRRESAVYISFLFALSTGVGLGRMLRVVVAVSLSKDRRGNEIDVHEDCSHDHTHSVGSRSTLSVQLFSSRFSLMIHDPASGFMSHLKSGCTEAKLS